MVSSMNVYLFRLSKKFQASILLTNHPLFTKQENEKQMTL